VLKDKMTPHRRRHKRLIQWTMAARRKKTPSSYSEEPAFWADASFGTSAPMRFLFGLHRGTPTGVTSYLAVTIRTFNRSALTSTTSGQWPTHLLALTVW
jgi:hypothetical protein